jgi:hypothetical protein
MLAQAMCALLIGCSHTSAAEVGGNASVGPRSVGCAAEVAEVVRPFIENAPGRAAALGAAIATPTAKNPLVFFHLRKCAGSTMRRQLVRAATEVLGADYYVPCFGGIDCPTYAIQQGVNLRRNISVYGGHLFQGDVQRGLRQLARTPRYFKVPPPQFSCFTILRKPTERVQSCWNFRMENGPLFHDIPTARIRSSLRSATDGFGHGCNNEGLRIFADEGASEGMINTLTSTEPWHPAATFALGSALENMERCVIGTLERCEESARVLGFYFPFLRGHIGCRKGHELKGPPRRPFPAAEQAERDALILEQNVLDQALYTYADAALDAQLAYVEAQIRSRGGG